MTAQPAYELPEGPPAGLDAVMRDSGPVGVALAAVDWTNHRLGPPSAWPRSLANAVQILLTSKFSMWMAWGPDLTFFCNDAYRRDTLAAKFPWALGRPAAQVWEEIWPDIGPRIERVVASGEATWDERLPLFLERSGYVEESYHTFSYSPLRGDDDRIAGMLCVVTEDTPRVISERRMGTLRDLGADTTVMRTEADVFAAASRHLAANPHCLPFTLTYLYDDDGTARLACATGLTPGHPAAPVTIAPGDGQVWPTELDGRSEVQSEVLVEQLDLRFRRLPTGAWPQPPQRAALLPLSRPDGSRPYGFLVVGLNRYRPWDDGYRGFLHLLAGYLASRVATARGYEAERRRAEALADLDQAKTAFFTNISHEFRTPLTLLLGPAGDALADAEHPLADAQRDRVEVVQRNALRLLRLVNTLLDVARLESGRVEPQLDRVDLGEYTAELVSMFEPAYARAGLTFSFTVDRPDGFHSADSADSADVTPDGRLEALVDRDMWAQIVLNLLSNALKHTFEGSVTVRLGVDADTVVLSVADTGIGIDPEHQAHLFERFHRVPGARSRSHEGSGIGLALVAELAAVHGGTATVTSEPGRGSTFRVTLARGQAAPDGAREPVPHAVSVAVTDAVADGLSQVQRHGQGHLAEVLRWSDAARVPAHMPPEDDDAPAGRARVLVVDDNADMRSYVAGLLADTYVVDTAADGLEALERLEARRCDLVVTDVMMPRLDGFGLVAALRADPRIADIPVVMLSARSGGEATVEGLDAGADDYLVKPFAARELRARVRANLELDRTRRTTAELQRSRLLLDQAQRIAGVGSWEIDLRTGNVTVSEEFARQVGRSVEELGRMGYESALTAVVDPRDAPRVRAALEAAQRGVPLDLELRMQHDGGAGTYRVLGELHRDDAAGVLRLSGSTQDVTEQRRAVELQAAAAAAEQAAEREHAIAEQLQLSLLPASWFDTEHLHVATYYRAGVEGTHVGGDWYDVIELGAGRVGLVIGDVMGRGVPAAAIMGQLRSAVRAFSRLDLPPADLLELMDGMVRDLGEDQIVTCLYAVYDPGERSLTYANAGHLPPLLVSPDHPPRRLTSVAGPPLGTGPVSLVEERIELRSSTTIALYTDGLVERRDIDIDRGIDALAELLTRTDPRDPREPAHLVSTLLPDGPDDDIAVLLVNVADEPSPATSCVWHFPSDLTSVQVARRAVTATLVGWGLSGTTVEDIVLAVSELVTNALVHAQPPIELRLRQGRSHVVVEVHDRSPVLPRKHRPSLDDEHGRGLHLLSHVAHRWGTRPTSGGKAVWCTFTT